MAPTTSPQFLSLPREIRDTIYKYTRAETTVLWNWATDPDGDIPYDIAAIIVSGLPTPALLCVSTQVHAEYQQIIRSWHVSAICHLELHDGAWMPAPYLSEPHGLFHSAKVLAQITEATIMVRVASRQYHFKTTEFPIPRVQPLFKALVADAPHLRDIRLVLYQDKEGEDAHWLMFKPGHREQYSAATRNKYFTPAPREIEGFGLTRAGEGYKLHCGGTIPTFQGPGKLLFHLQTRVGVYLYRRPDSERGEISGSSCRDGGVDLLTHEVLVAPGMARPYSKETLDAAAEHERYQINRWKDPREEAAEWLEDEEKANKWTREMQEWVEFEE